jgi:predicted NAD-dependent protein-ADP-ribosyltransferase YbiA (DUF1768 family)
MPVLSKSAAAAAAATSTSTNKTTWTDPEDEPVYFWKPHQKDGYLGQWFDSEFTVDGCVYETAEKWMMVMKARLFGDEVSRSDNSEPSGL